MSSASRVDLEPSDGRAATVLALALGVVMFSFGFLKLFEPIRTWFHVQVTNSHLPPGSFVMGIAGELAIGVAFLGSVVARGALGRHRPRLVAATCVALVANMCVAVYVHLQPNVPASVLPLGIKPPIIPLTVMGLAVWELVLVTRRATSDEQRTRRG